VQTGRNDEQETRGVGAADEEEVIAEAIRRETFMSDFYRYILDKIGYDVQPIIAQMIDEQQKRIQLLERVQFDIHERRELTGSIAD